MIDAPEMTEPDVSALPFRGRFRGGLAGGWLPDPSTQAVDLSCCSVALLVMDLREPIFTQPHALTEVLTMRFSMANLVVLALWLVLWSVVLRITEMPAESSAGTLTQCFRLAGRMLLCTLVVAVVLLAIRPGMATA